MAKFYFSYLHSIQPTTILALLLLTNQAERNYFRTKNTENCSFLVSFGKLLQRTFHKINFILCWISFTKKQSHKNIHEVCSSHC